MPASFEANWRVNTDNVLYALKYSGKPNRHFSELFIGPREIILMQIDNETL